MATSTGGMIARTPAALMNENEMVKSDVNDATMIGSVCEAVVCVNMRAQRNSFQHVRKVNSTTATRDGVESGRNTFVSAWNREQPSTRAALSSSSGNPSKYCSRMNTVKGIVTAR